MVYVTRTQRQKPAPQKRLNKYSLTKQHNQHKNHRNEGNIDFGFKAIDERRL